MRNSLKFVLTIGLAAAAFAATGAEPVQTYSTKVQYGDLNLESQQGVAQLYARLFVAARRVCSDNGGTVDLAQKRVQRRCMHEAIATAVSKVNKPQLTAYYRARNGFKEAQLFSKL